ncbi:MAG TPA: M15 family metallopeptidase [Bacteroidia bacterium]
MLKHIMMCLVVSTAACQQNQSRTDSNKANQDSIKSKLELKADKVMWVQVYESDSIGLLMPYADTNNFTHTKLYTCIECQLRPAVAEALLKASHAAKEKGYKLEIFDCYRPYSVQVKMFELIGDERYVAKPGKGSNHNKGCAVDLSLSKNGKLLDMGSAFDAFGESSSVGYSKLNKQQRQNRQLLQSIMTESGFVIYEHEWWHFNFKDTNFETSDHPFNCKN